MACNISAGLPAVQRRLSHASKFSVNTSCRGRRLRQAFRLVTSANYFRAGRARCRNIRTASRSVTARCGAARARTPRRYARRGVAVHTAGRRSGGEGFSWLTASRSPVDAVGGVLGKIFGRRVASLIPLQPSVLSEGRKINARWGIPSTRAIAGAKLLSDLPVAVRNS